MPSRPVIGSVRIARRSHNGFTVRFDADKYVQCHYSEDLDKSWEKASMDGTLNVYRARLDGYEKNTVLTVKNGNQTVNVLVDNDGPANNDTIELSQASAAKLGITADAKDTQCRVQRLLIENHPKLKHLLSVIPIVGGFVFLCFIYNTGILAMLA